MQCVILAGGMGTRMWPEAQALPKTLLPVAGRPFADHQLSWLSAAGVRRVVYCLGFLGNQVTDYVGDGSRWGLQIGFVDEGEHLRGTAGALRLALDAGALEEDFLVLYGDSWLQVDPAAVLRHLRKRQEPAVMTVFRNEGRWDLSNVELDGDRVSRYAKGSGRAAAMSWIDYGLLAFRREVVAERVRPGGASDLAPLCAGLAEEGLLAAYVATERFYEIGSPSGRQELEAHLHGSGQVREVE